MHFVTSDPNALKQPHDENARLLALVRANGIEIPWAADSVGPAYLEPWRPSAEEKVALLRRLFQGRAGKYLLAGRAVMKAVQAQTPPNCCSRRGDFFGPKG
jgi:hypothetical protein